MSNALFIALSRLAETGRLPSEVVAKDGFCFSVVGATVPLLVGRKRKIGRLSSYDDVSSVNRMYAR